MNSIRREPGSQKVQPIKGFPELIRKQQIKRHENKPGQPRELPKKVTMIKKAVVYDRHQSAALGNRVVKLIREDINFASNNTSRQ